MTPRRAPPTARKRGALRTLLWPPLAPAPAMAMLEAQVNARIVGQKALVRGLIIALLADGHVLLEGPSGLAKTRAVRALAEGMEASFRRLVPHPEPRVGEPVGEVAVMGTSPVPAGGVFANIVLAESIERVSPEARFALLDAMAERQAVVDGVPEALPQVFLVCATRTLTSESPANGMLPEERDRFLLNLRVGYPSATAERLMLGLVRAEGALAGDRAGVEARLPLATLLAARAKVRAVRVGPKTLRRITSLVAATRGGSDPRSNDVLRWIRSGVGPRGSIALERCARAHAWLAGRRQVTERDLIAVAHDVLRHRIELSEAAERAGITADGVIDQLLAAALP
jgi:MoxR-like ATPase